MSESKRYRGGMDYRTDARDKPPSQGNPTYQAKTTENPLRTQLGRAKRSVSRFGQAIDRAIPNVRTVDGMAYELARRTPRTIAICLILLIAGIVASRLNLWVEGFLWGIPSLGAISMGLGFWIWSTNVLMRPDLSAEARAALKRAIRLQWIMIIAGVLAIIYFAGMVARFW
ncbi:MAG: hypothetical protein MI924_11375 [Chloroflexales bacterium]|nr:hypothetical protein [Chloroflexales bacterium]